MKLPEHITLSFLIAQLGVQPEYGLAGTVLMVVAGNLPDIDTLTLFGGNRLYRRYHRIVGHGLPVTLFGPGLLAALGSWGFDLGPFWPLWFWLQVALLAHLFSDVCFYRWPVQLLWPFSSRGWGFGLVSWNDLVPTLVLYSTSAVALCWPAAAFTAAWTGVGLFLLYLAWRGWGPTAESGWMSWLTGDWAETAAPVWKWLTGDFLT
jgi:membrane-bound metal-dependent hydrolase YbcI (DUF457 family)